MRAKHRQCHKKKKQKQSQCEQTKVNDYGNKYQASKGEKKSKYNLYKTRSGVKREFSRLRLVWLRL